ncbi:MAG: reductive dehalogenase [Burkholderiaceae bacterium]
MDDTAAPPTDRLAGFEVTDRFERFDQKDDVFRRSWHDPEMRSEAAMRFYRTYRETLSDWRKADGFRQQDYALRNAAWHVSDLFTEAREHEDRREGFSDAFSQNREPAAEKADIGDTRQAAREVKRAARLFGAADVGITTTDPRWLYTRKFSDMSGTARENDIAADLDRVIVTVQPMDAALLDTVPSALSGTATGLGYSHDALVVLALAQYIRNLGYRAVASMNDSSLCIPTAVQAGLGEYGRHGLLITPGHGPRVRLGKVFTDMPLATDEPVRFGVREFCERCRRCSDGCPAKAIPDGDPSTARHNRSNIIGIRKWSVDGERCFTYWTKQNTDCAICIRVCPFNRDFSRLPARVWQWVVRHGVRRWPALTGWLVRLDDRLGHGRRRKPADWWTQAARRQ